jgi:hypothetical protein
MRRQGTVYDSEKVWDLMVAMGRHILDRYYPEDVFTGESGDLGPRYIVALRNALRALDEDNADEA